MRKYFKDMAQLESDVRYYNAAIRRARAKKKRALDEIRKIEERLGLGHETEQRILKKEVREL